MSGLRVVLEVCDQILQHLAPRPLLHPGEVWRGVGGPLGVDHLGEEPLPEHGALAERGLLPQVRLVRADLVPCHHRYLEKGQK